MYVTLATIAHFVWEIGHIRLYTIWDTGRFGEIAFAIIHCTLGDALIAATTMSFAMLAFRRDPTSAFLKIVSVATALGMAFTILSEWLNVEVRRTWAYMEAMPRLPFLGTGLTPVVQWLLITPLAAAAARRARRARARCGDA